MRKIFLSSTFRDMQTERDIIHTTVLPELRTIARQYGEDLEICDLRWGVNTRDMDGGEASRKVLSVCLDEIDRCRPFMLVMLGERYGWVPERELLQDAAGRKNFCLEELEKSVTELEIEYGALNDPEALKRSLFLFREPIPEAGADYRSKGEGHTVRLNTLKDRIRRLAGDRVFTYRLDWDDRKGRTVDNGQFARMVTEQLRTLLEEDWRMNAELHENEKEEKRHWGFVDVKVRQFGGRDGLLAGCMKKLEEGRGTLLITGEAGSGKSTLLSRMVSDYREMGWNVYPFICGNTGRSVSAMDILRQWIFYVEGILGIGHFEDEDASEEVQGMELPPAEGVGEAGRGKTVEDWKDRLQDVLAMYCAGEDYPRLLLAADGVDQLNRDELAEEFGFLPRSGREKIRFLLSCLKDCGKGNYDGDEIEVGAMTRREMTDALCGMLSYWQKELDRAVMDEIMNKRGADNPLYLSLLVQRLAMMDRDDFDVIAGYGNDMAAINRYQTELVSGAPERAEELSRLLIEKTGEQVNRKLVKGMAGYIAVSRRGLRGGDLQALLEDDGIPWSSLDFSRAVHYMPVLFTERTTDGQIDLTHRVIREGLCEGLDVRGLQRRIFEHLKGLPAGDGLRGSEMVYYCHVLDEKEYLAKYLEHGDERIREKAAEELYRICMEDSGKWYEAVLQVDKDVEGATKMADFVCNYLNKLFVKDSMFELGIRLRINDRVMQICRKLYEENPTAEGVWNEYGMSCENVGDIYGKQEKLDEALEKYEEARVIFQKMKEELQTSESATFYSISCKSVGDIYMKKGMFDDALEKYKEAYAISRKLYEEQVGGAGIYNSCCICIGDIYIESGKLDEALEKYEKGYTIIRKLYEERQTPMVERNYSISCSRIGRIYEKQGKLDKALEKYEEYHKINRKLYEEQQTPKSAMGYSVSCSIIGGIYEKQGKLDKALELYDETRRIRYKLYEEQQTPLSARNYSTSCGKVGDIYKKQGKVDKALELYEEYYEVSRKLYDENPIPMNARVYSTSCSNIGGIYEEQGELDEALEMYGKCHVIRHKLYEELKTPDSARWYRTSCSNVGSIYEKQGKLDEALEKYGEDYAISRRLYKEKPTPENARDYGISCNRIGGIYEKQGRLDEALEKYGECYTVSLKLYEGKPTLENERRCGVSCYYVGSIYEKQGRLDEALEKYEEYHAMSCKMYEKAPMPESTRDYGISCNRIGGIYEKQGRLDEALEKYGEDYVISRRLYKEKPTPESARDYGISCNRIGGIYEKQGKLDEALEKYGEYHAVSRRLYEETPTPESARDYGISFQNIGDIYEKQGRLDEALEKYEEYHAMSCEMYEKTPMPESAGGYGISCSRIGGIYEKQGKLNEALAKYGEDYAVRRKIYEEKPTSENARGYGMSCNRIGSIYEKQGRLDGALAKYEEGNAIFLKIHKELHTSRSERDYDSSCIHINRIHRLKQTQKNTGANVLDGDSMLIGIFNATVQKYMGMDSSTPKLYSLESLNVKQIINILKYCAKGLAEEDIIVFCSTKMYHHNGKKGYVFTGKGIYADDSINIGTKRKKIDMPILYSDIEKCEYEEQYSDYVKCILADGKCMYIYTDAYSRFFADVINQIVHLVRNM